MHYYTYYSYEEYGRGYIGHRGCKCSPEQDINYFGSFTDETFKPTQKIILKSDYTTREEAISDEVILHDYYNVANNLHFANKAKQTSTKFYVSLEQARENGKKSAKKNKENGTGIFAQTKEQRSENAKISGKKNKENGTGIFAQTKEQRSENGSKAGKIGGKIGGKISGKKAYENKIGIHALTKEQRSEHGSKAGKIGGKINAERTAREFIIVSPTGEVIHGRNLKRFARENNLNASNLRFVLNGKYKQCKGYTRYNDN